MLLTNQSKFKLLEKIALWLHAQHSQAYSFYKVRQSGILLELPLNSSERDFYLRLQQTLKGNSLVIYDIGAADGVVSSCLAKIKNVQTIHAFEPIPTAYDELITRMQKFPKVKTHNIALGDKEGEFEMHISSNSDSSSLLPLANLHKEQRPQVPLDITHKIIVPVFKLDDYVKQHQLAIPNLIKMDVQGYEKNVIEGGVNTISQAEYCIMEMSFVQLYENSPLFDDIYRLMYNLGFKLIGLDNPLKGSTGVHLQVDGIFQNQKLSKC
jgi:FkbM family methyltransferase